MEGFSGVLFLIGTLVAMGVWERNTDLDTEVAVVIEELVQKYEDSLSLYDLLAHFPIDENIACPESDTRLPYPGDCTRYITCRDFKAHIRGCPRGMKFDKEVLRCRFAFQTTCNDTAQNNNDCGSNEIYQSCGPACVETCNDFQDQDIMCHKECVQGCFCNEGFVRGPLRNCVPRHKCEKSNMLEPWYLVDTPQIMADTMTNNADQSENTMWNSNGRWNSNGLANEESENKMRISNGKSENTVLTDGESENKMWNSNRKSENTVLTNGESENKMWNSNGKSENTVLTNGESDNKMWNSNGKSENTVLTDGESENKMWNSNGKSENTVLANGDSELDNGDSGDSENKMWNSNPQFKSTMWNGNRKSENTMQKYGKLLEHISSNVMKSENMVKELELSKQMLDVMKNYELDDNLFVDTSDVMMGDDQFQQRMDVREDYEQDMDV